MGLIVTEPLELRWESRRDHHCGHRGFDESDGTVSRCGLTINHKGRCAAITRDGRTAVWP